MLTWSHARGTRSIALALAFTTFVLFQVFNVFNARVEQGLGVPLGPHQRCFWLAIGGVVVLQVAVHLTRCR